ncbi:dolichol-phosphate mannosyltransferase subunit 3 [Spinellus fusiger]|nr:dolichol-phosphate mannosyltransferase subunit 3 [Spinellus fusiger]
MTRAVEAFTALTLFSIVYIALSVGLVPLPEIIQNQIIPVFPWWLLMTFGSYSLGNLGWHIMTFSDCPKAYAELLEEIQTARSDLVSKGVVL